MEEVWNDITLPSLNPNPNPNSHFQTLAFQDFLSQPFTNRNPNPNLNPISTVVSAGGNPSAPPISLNLNSVPERYNSPCNSDGFIHNPFLSIGNVPTHYLNNASFDELPEIGRKRFPESDGSGDRRHKRMIKNRESAARSRARKQAYTNELELEVAHLMEENARLKRQQEELCLAAASHVPKKQSLHRATTAPF